MRYTVLNVSSVFAVCVVDAGVNAFAPVDTSLIVSDTSVHGSTSAIAFCDSLARTNFTEKVAQFERLSKHPYHRQLRLQSTTSPDGVPVDDVAIESPVCASTKPNGTSNLTSAAELLFASCVTDEALVTAVNRNGEQVANFKNCETSKYVEGCGQSSSVITERKEECITRTVCKPLLYQPKSVLLKQSSTLTKPVSSSYAEPPKFRCVSNIHLSPKAEQKCLKNNVLKVIKRNALGYSSDSDCIHTTVGTSPGDALFANKAHVGVIKKENKSVSCGEDEHLLVQSYKVTTLSSNSHSVVVGSSPPPLCTAASVSSPVNGLVRNSNLSSLPSREKQASDLKGAQRQPHSNIVISAEGVCESSVSPSKGHAALVKALCSSARKGNNPRKYKSQVVKDQYVSSNIPTWQSNIDKVDSHTGNESASASFIQVNNSCESDHIPYVECGNLRQSNSAIIENLVQSDLKTVKNFAESDSSAADNIVKNSFTNKTHNFGEKNSSITNFFVQSDAINSSEPVSDDHSNCLVTDLLQNEKISNIDKYSAEIISEANKSSQFDILDISEQEKTILPDVVNFASSNVKRPASRPVSLDLFSAVQNKRTAPVLTTPKKSDCKPPLNKNCSKSSLQSVSPWRINVKAHLALDLTNFKGEKYFPKGTAVTNVTLTPPSERAVKFAYVQNKSCLQRIHVNNNKIELCYHSDGETKSKSRMKSAKNVTFSDARTSSLGKMPSSCFDRTDSLVRPSNGYNSSRSTSSPAREVGNDMMTNKTMTVSNGHHPSLVIHDSSISAMKSVSLLNGGNSGNRLASRSISSEDENGREVFDDVDSDDLDLSELTASQEELRRMHVRVREDRKREQEASKREQERLEEILNMCEAYERQLELERKQSDSSRLRTPAEAMSGERVRLPSDQSSSSERLKNSKIMTNGSLTMLASPPIRHRETNVFDFKSKHESNSSASEEEANSDVTTMKRRPNVSIFTANNVPQQRIDDAEQLKSNVHREGDITATETVGTKLTVCETINPLDRINEQNSERKLISEPVSSLTNDYESLDQFTTVTTPRVNGDANLHVTVEKCNYDETDLNSSSVSSPSSIPSPEVGISRYC